MVFRQVFKPYVCKRFISQPCKSGRPLRQNVLLGTLVTGISGTIIWNYQTQIKELWQDYISDTKELSPDDFTKYRITNRVDIDSCHYFMELTPIKEQKVNLWELFGGEKLWSVEVKQPEIMVVRNYTPLPLKFDPVHKQLQQIDVTCGNNNGKLVFYIKSYDRGEVARWLHRLPIGELVELRGPTVDCNISMGHEKISHSEQKKQSDIAAFTAGTGIVAALQLGLNPYSRFKGKIDLYHSCNRSDELGQLLKFLTSLEQSDKMRLHLFELSKGETIGKAKSEIPQPFTDKKSSDKLASNCKLALVCGPEGYITEVAGMKYDLQQGPVAGLLKEKGWGNHNVWKLN
ncbi:Cytochrome c mitochondrial import factor CYC2 [Nakaseomyces bracarensis]|uniref:Cytochrome c mitochondrial import factor CYC2 n=1 Tax=Nakaseomyces bracarensis TaxID=273131 RepID=A0ABR4NPQ9_9SACH